MAMASDADLVLLCLPCAGASATMYLRWQRRLPPGLRVVPVELP
ncbi:thioesterase, partial [Acidovorax cattleyae]|nr:thioesterase [Paracidovorax cattleyae]